MAVVVTERFVVENYGSGYVMVRDVLSKRETLVTREAFEAAVQQLVARARK